MSLRHPWSFFLMIVVIVMTAWGNVSWTAIHVIGMIITIALIVALRSLSHKEGKREAHK